MLIRNFLIKIISITILISLSSCTYLELFDLKIEDDKDLKIKVKSSDEVSVLLKKSNTYILLNFDYGGANSIYGLSRVEYIPKQVVESEDISKYDPYPLVVSSDWIGPYIVRATAEKDTEGAFTGGWHPQGGEPTAKTLRVTFLADGVEVDRDETINCNNLLIRVQNEINAYNASRPVISEEVTYTISEDRVDVSVRGLAKEKIEIKKYYGLQSQNYLWNGTVTYKHSDGKNKSYTHSIWSKSAHKETSILDRYVLKSIDKSRGLVVGLLHLGIGNFEFLQDDMPCAFTDKVGKSYFNLINGKSLKLDKGEDFFWQGYYIFF